MHVECREDNESDLEQGTHILDPLKQATKDSVPLCASHLLMTSSKSPLRRRGEGLDEQNGHTEAERTGPIQETAESPIIKGGKVNDDKGRTSPARMYAQASFGTHL